MLIYMHQLTKTKPTNVLDLLGQDKQDLAGLVLQIPKHVTSTTNHVSYPNRTRT
jgi:hypothetical protein